MLFLCLAILSSSLVSIVMRLSGGRVKHGLGMLTMNYIICTLLSGLSGGFRDAFDLGNPQIGLTLAMGTVNGALYLISFMMMQSNTKKNGVVLTSIFQKLGLLVTFLVSVVCYREVPAATQTVGFCLAVFAIVLMNYRKVSGGAGSRTGLVWMLLACGMSDAMSKVFTESGVASLEGQFLMYTFGVAMGLCVVCMTVEGQRIGTKEALYGTLIAVPNFFSSKFLLGALERLRAVIVYPVFSVGSILVVTLTGLLVFRERLDRKQWIGIAVILAALVLLNI